MNTLNNENIIYVPNTLDGENIVSSHLEENSLLIDGTNQMLANLNAGNYRLTHVSNAISSTDAVNKGQLDLKADTTYVDTNYLNKVITTSQSVASRLTFNNATSGSSFPIIELQNAITGSNNGMYLRFFKNFNRLPNTEIGSIVFADKDAISPAISRAVQLTGSIDSASNPLLNITFDSGIFNPLTISNTQTILRCDDFYIKNKTTAQNLLYYTSSNDFWVMSKSLNMAQNNITNVGDLMINNQIDMTSGKIINLLDPVSAQDASTKNYTDTASVNTNYLKRDGSLAMLGAINMNTTNKITNLAEPTLAQDACTKNYTDTHSNNSNYLLRNGTLPMTGNLQMGSYKITNLLECDDLNDGANKAYVDTHSNNQNYLLRNGTLPMTGNLNLSTHDLITSGTIDCNIIDANGDINTTADMSCADFTSNGNQVIGDSSANVLDVKSSAFFEADVLIETNKHLAFNSGTLSTTNGMLMNYDGGVGFLDVRGSEFRIRTDASANPTGADIRFKVNDTNTTVRNNFFCDANSTFGNENTDTATFNSKITIHNILTFATGSRVDGARVQLIKSGNISYTMTDNNVENGVLCNNSSTISITMPAKSPYWNNRCYFVKVRTANVNLVQNTDTRIDDDESTLVMSSDFRGYLLQFDSDYENNGDIWRLCQI